MLFLKQSTASQSVKIGPFLDSTDGTSPESGLTVANTDIKLSKAGGAFGNKNSGGGTHDAQGWYTITLDATDTATVGPLQLSSQVSGACPVWHEFTVLEEAIYDALFAASANAFSGAAGSSITTANVTQFGGSNITSSSGRPEVNASHWAGTAVGSTEVRANLINIAGAAVSTSSAQLGVNVVNAAGTAWNSGAIGPNTLASDTITAAKVAADVSTEIRNAITGGAYALDTDSNGRVRIVDGTGAGELDTSSGTVLLRSATETQIDDIQTAIAALNNFSTTDFNNRIIAYGLDHLVAVATSGGEVANNSIIARLANSGATAVFDSFDNTTDSLQAIRDHIGDGTNLTEAGGTGDHLTAITTVTDQLADTLEDQGGGTYGFTEAALQEAPSGGGSAPTVEEIRQEMDDNSTKLAAIVGDTNELQTDWANGGRLDLLIDAIKAKTDQLAFTVSNRVDSTTQSGLSTLTAQNVWEYATRILTALDEDSTTLDLDATIRAAVGLSSANLDTQIAALPTQAEITGGSYSLDTDANGRVRVVDGTGAGEISLTSGLLDWNPAWDAEVQSEATDALNAYDPPTRGELTTDINSVLSAVSGLNNITVSQILTTQMTQSYAANGVAPTLAQALFAIHQKLMAHKYDGTDSIVYRLDGTTEAFRGELDDATNPAQDIRTAA